MGLFDSIGNALSDVASGVGNLVSKGASSFLNNGGIGSLISGGLSLLGGQQRNASQVEQAQASNAFSAQQYAARWQTTTKDMQAAGLNPMLAYTQGVGSSPSGQQASIDDVYTPAVQAANNYQQTRANSANVANIEADTDNKRAQADLIAAQAAQAWSTAGLNRSQMAVADQMALKVSEEIKNIPTEGDRLRAAINLMYHQAVQSGSQDMLNLQNIDLVKYTAQKIISETGLNNMSLDAMKSLGNIGNMSKELQPIARAFLMLLSRK